MIHTDHPFRDPVPDPVRRLRGRLTGAVTLWVSQDGPRPVGLTVSSLMVAAGERLKSHVTVTGMGGGCDANILNRRGFEVANLGTGMRDIHTVKEWLDVNDMVFAAEVLLEAIALNGQRP